MDSFLISLLGNFREPQKKYAFHSPLCIRFGVMNRQRTGHREFSHLAQEL